MYSALPTKRLVILGEPGSGKTAFAMVLTVDLINLQPQPAQLTPVMFSIATWEPAREHLHIWLTRRILEDYWLMAPTSEGRANITELISDGRIVPVLDGIDEMPDAARRDVLISINQMHAALPIVLTCRTEAFEEVIQQGGTALAEASVIDISPVEPDDAADFLSSTLILGDPRWQPVLEHLRRAEDSPLLEALSTPLMVSLAQVAYKDISTNPTEMLDEERFDSAALLERHLLDSYVNAAYTPVPRPHRHSSSPPLREYDAADSRRWLSTIATYLNDTKTWYLAWWNVAGLVSERSLELTSRILLSVLAALAFGLFDALGYGPDSVWAGALLGLAISVVCSFVFGLTSSTPQTERGSPHILARILVWIVYPMIAGVLSGTSLALTEPRKGGLTVGVVTFLIFLVIVQPTIWLMRRVGRWVASWRYRARDAAAWSIGSNLRRLLTQLAYAVLAATAISVIIGVSYLADGAAAALISFARYFLTFGLIAILLLGLGLVRQDGIPSRINTRIIGRLRAGGKYVGIGLWIGLLHGLILAMIFVPVVETAVGTAHRLFGDPSGNRDGNYPVSVVVAVCLIVGVACGIAAGVSGWLNAPIDLAMAPDPRSVLRRARVAALAWMLVCVCIVCLAIAMATPWITKPGSVVAFGGGLVSVMSILALTSNAWGRLHVALAILAVRGKLPLRLFRFLDDAHRREVIRHSGPFYQFRHRRLQECLADFERARPVDRRDPVHRDEHEAIVDRMGVE